MTQPIRLIFWQLSTVDKSDCCIGKQRQNVFFIKTSVESTFLLSVPPSIYDFYSGIFILELFVLSSR